MQVSLRKAAQLRTKLETRLEQVTLPLTVTVPVFELVTGARLDEGREQALAALILARRGHQALTELRRIIAGANHASQVDAKLAQKAGIERELRLLLGIRRPAVLETLETVQARQATQRKLAESPEHAYHAQPTVAADVLTAGDYENLAQRIYELTQAQQAVADDLLALNLQTRVDLPDEVVEVLALHRII